MLADQRIVRAALQVGRQLQASAQQLFPRRRGAFSTVAHRDAEVNHAIGIGEHDVAEAAAGLPEALRHRRQLPVITLGHQRRHVGREEQAQVAGIAGVADARVLLDAVEGEEGDPCHEQAHHQGGHRQQLGLQAEFGPPAGQGLQPGRIAVGGCAGGGGGGRPAQGLGGVVVEQFSSRGGGAAGIGHGGWGGRDHQVGGLFGRRRTWWPMSRRKLIPSKLTPASPE